MKPSPFFLAEFIPADWTKSITELSSFGLLALLVWFAGTKGLPILVDKFSGVLEKQRTDHLEAERQSRIDNRAERDEWRSSISAFAKTVAELAGMVAQMNVTLTAHDQAMRAAHAQELATTAARVMQAREERDAKAREHPIVLP